MDGEVAIPPGRSATPHRFKWVSSFGSDFKGDHHVSFTPEEVARGKFEYNYSEQQFPSDEGSGASVFYKDATGTVFHTYSTYGRGWDLLIGAYNYLDLVPKGRDEGGLEFPMAWVRHHDRYTDDCSSDQKPRDAATATAGHSRCSTRKSHA